MHPIAHPLMYQNWMRVTFLHWRYDAAQVQSLLPAQLKVDTFDGSAWVGLVPFEILGLRLAGTPAIPWLGSFRETNVRTYVIGPDGRPGVWFFSLDAARLLAVVGARLSYGLPYHWARMSLREDAGVVRYRSSRYLTKGSVDVGIRPGELLQQSELEEFLTARYGLFSLHRNRLQYGPVEHVPWPLNQAEVLDLRQDLVEAAGLTSPRGEPVVHFSPGVEVRVGALGS